MLNISRINIGSGNFFSFVVAYAATLILVGALIFRRRLLARAADRGISEKKFYAVYFGVSGGIFLLGWIFSLSFYGGRGGKVGNVFLIFAYFFISAIVFAVIIALIYLLVWLLVRLIVAQSGRPSPSVSLGGEVQNAAAVSAEKVFPGLIAIDELYAGTRPAPVPQQLLYSCRTCGGFSGLSVGTLCAVLRFVYASFFYRGHGGFPAYYS